jgi:hypothetical protein
MAERASPFELIFGRTGLAAAHFPRIAASLEPVAGSGPDREQFLMLGPVAELMGELASASGEGTAQIALLTFHAFHRWQQGGEDHELGEGALRELLALGGIGEWQFQPPAPAGYLRLPGHLLWVAGAEGQPAEPVDGFFWVVGGSRANALDLLLVLGVHEGRPGVTVIELGSGPVPGAGHWGDLQVRSEGADFGNVLPGGDHLYGLSAAGEVLKLVSRLFWHLQRHG